MASPRGRRQGRVGDDGLVRLEQRGARCGGARFFAVAVAAMVAIIAVARAVVVAMRDVGQDVGQDQVGRQRGVRGVRPATVAVRQPRWRGRPSPRPFVRFAPILLPRPASPASPAKACCCRPAWSRDDASPDDDAEAE